MERTHVISYFKIKGETQNVKNITATYWVGGLIRIYSYRTADGGDVLAVVYILFSLSIRPSVFLSYISKIGLLSFRLLKVLDGM